MPEYEFQILCRDGDKVCDDVMKSMKKQDFDKVKRKELCNADHSGIKECDNISNAEQISNGLFQEHHGNIHRVTIVPR